MLGVEAGACEIARASSRCTCGTVDLGVHPVPISGVSDFHMAATNQLDALKDLPTEGDRNASLQLPRVSGNANSSSAAD